MKQSRAYLKRRTERLVRASVETASGSRKPSPKPSPEPSPEKTNAAESGVRWFMSGLTPSQRSGLNRRPLDYESSALPLSYAGDMPWRGLEPRRLTAPPPQDGVSTNFTTRATSSHTVLPDDDRALRVTGLTGLEPATSGVTDRHSNQLSYSPNVSPPPPHALPSPHSPKGSRTPLCTLKECRPNR